MVFIKRVDNSDGGDADHWGGDHLDNLDKILDDVDIESTTGKPAKINTNWEFRNGKLYIWNAANTFKYNITSGILGANVNLELPDLSANGKLIAAGGPNDWGTALQTFRDQNIVFRNPANSASYIWVTSAITANRNITIPLLLANDTFTFNNFTAELINKTLHIDLNTFKHSTTNAQGDLYKYDSTSGKIIRVPRGTAGQVLKVNAGGTDLEWGTDETGVGSIEADEIKIYEGGIQVGTVARKLNFNSTDFNVTEDALNNEFDIALASPGGGGGGSADVLYDNLNTSSGFKYGLWNGESDFSGYGLLGNISGFDVSGIGYINSSSGVTGQEWTISSTNAVGWKTNNLITMRKLNPDVTFSFQLDENGDNTGSRFYAGFASSPNVAKDSSFLDDLSGVLMFKHSNDNFFQINHNDGSGTAVEDGSILTTDSGLHTFRVFADDVNTRFRWQLDGGTINNVSTDIPSSTAQLAVVLNASDADSSTRFLRGFWTKFKMQERA